MLFGKVVELDHELLSCIFPRDSRRGEALGLLGIRGGMDWDLDLTEELFLAHG